VEFRVCAENEFQTIEMPIETNRRSNVSRGAISGNYQALAYAGKRLKAYSIHMKDFMQPNILILLLDMPLLGRRAGFHHLVQVVYHSCCRIAASLIMKM
jgi:hypothetical protein